MSVHNSTPTRCKECKLNIWFLENDHENMQQGETKSILNYIILKLILEGWLRMFWYFVVCLCVGVYNIRGEIKYNT